VLRSNRLEMMARGTSCASPRSPLKEEREALRAAETPRARLEPAARPLREGELRPRRRRPRRQGEGRAQRAWQRHVRRPHEHDHRARHPHGLQDASELITQLDTQKPEVLIEANIVEATEDFSRGLGVQWATGTTRAATGTRPYELPRTSARRSGLGSGRRRRRQRRAGSVLPFLADFPVPGNFGSGFGANNGSALDLRWARSAVPASAPA